jgi:hypothetical protein
MLVVIGNPAIECVNQPVLQPQAFFPMGTHEPVGVGVPLGIVIDDASQEYKMPFIQQMTRSLTDRHA